MATETEVKAPAQHKEVEQFSDAERTEWLKTGKMPALETDLPKEDASAASTPDKKSGSGPDKKEDVKSKQGQNWRALETERDSHKTAREAAERELEEWRSGKKKTEEKKADAGPKLLEMPVRPKMKEFMGEGGVLDSDKYEAALDKYETDKSAYVNQQTQIRTAQAQQEQYVNNWKTELKAKYGEKSDGIDVKKTADKLAGTMKDAPAFFMFLSDSEVFTDLLFVLGTDPKLDELLAEARDAKTAAKAVRKLFVIETGVKEELAKQAKDKSDDESPKKENLTKAGKPPAEAAGSSSSPADDGSPDAAWKRKDLSPEERGELYRERKNKQEREARKKKVN